MFTFGHWQCGINEAANILNCSKRTIQNYYHPGKRDPIKWRYLELHVTRRILPESMWFNGDMLYMDTGYSYPAYELQQWAFFQSMKHNQIAELTAENERLKTRLHELKQQPQRRCNVIPFPTLTNGDLTA